MENATPELQKEYLNAFQVEYLNLDLINKEEFEYLKQP